ncbi:peptidase M56 [Paenibacillus alba]|uniref:Peptidase M56 n=1 Tax=Paenibacillus alba TaxID=1197127 RepID=A0ABU6FWZ8_9BACL|nr:peptidase M56 [Paenibacillus alba]MEC0226418.1 peptidase M56 [Paenibacillus alba]
MRKKLLYTLFLIISILFLPRSTVAEPQKLIHEGSKSLNDTIYKNIDYQVEFQYPKSWKPVTGYTPAKYEGTDGYFLISAVSGGGLNIDEVVKFNAYHKLQPYGSKPKIESLIISGQEARLILPSTDQDEHMHNEVSLMIKYPSPVIINGDKYDYLIIYADQNHIYQIGSTVTFIHS